MLLDAALADVGEMPGRVLLPVGAMTLESVGGLSGQYEETTSDPTVLADRLWRSCRLVYYYFCGW
jgi:hypothetical protein